MKKMKVKNINVRFDAIKTLLDKEINNEIDLPDNIVVFTLDDEELSKIITKKRMELIKIIKEKNPETVKELAEMVKRKLPAVDRDIRLLKEYDLVDTVRNKRGVKPIVKKQAIVLPLIEPKPLEAMINKTDR